MLDVRLDVWDDHRDGVVSATVGSSGSNVGDDWDKLRDMLSLAISDAQDVRPSLRKGLGDSPLDDVPKNHPNDVLRMVILPAPFSLLRHRIGYSL